MLKTGLNGPVFIEDVKAIIRIRKKEP